MNQVSYVCCCTKPKKKISNTDQKTAFHKYDWETVQRSFNAILIFIFRGQVIEKKVSSRPQEQK